MQSRAESGRDPKFSHGRAQQRTDHRTAMAVIPAHVGIGDDARFEVVRVFPCQIQRGRKSVGNVAGRTDPLTDDDFIRLARPLLSFALGKPVAAVLKDRLAQPAAGNYGDKHSGEGVGGFQHFRVTMGKLHMLAHGFARDAGIAAEKRAEHADVGEATDVDVAAAALARVRAAGVGGENFR